MSQDRDGPFISVVIPTHNRREMLIRVLEALFRQDWPRDCMEVVVVLDGCTDDTVEALQSLNPPCQFRYANLAKSGQAAARNKGIQLSVGEVLVFLDDDVEATPGLLSAHAAQHAQANDLVVQGYYPLSPHLARTLHLATVTRWWEQHFDRLAQPGHRLAHQDLCAGNLSIRRQHLLAVGGFDETFRGYGDEDYELGLRLANHGLRFRFCRKALGWHHYGTPLPKSLQRTREEARADLIYGRKYPRFKTTFRFFTMTQDTSFLHRAIRELAFRFPSMGDRIANRLLTLMDSCERFGLRECWVRINWGLRRYYYLRGLKDGLGSFAALKEYLGDDWIEHPAKRRTKVLSFDLRKGIPAVEGLNGYKAAYILLRDGPKPLTWLWWAAPGEWLSRADINEAIERKAWEGLASKTPEERRLSDAILPSLLKKGSPDAPERWFEPLMELPDRRKRVR